MSGKAFITLPNIAMLAVAGGLVALGISFRATDMAAMASAGGTEPVSIPAFPPAMQAEIEATDAFTRPLFTRERAPGPDKAPAVVMTSDDPDAPDGSNESSEAPTVKGLILIIGGRGSRVALQSADAAAPVWAKIGEEVGGWTVEAINAVGVRVRNGDNVANIKFSKDN